MNIVHNCDCMDFMKDKPDNYYDLAICDPPYGIKANHNRTGFMNHTISQNADNKSWDSERMPKEWIDELFRVSKNQIIWGYQYYSDLLPPTKGMIIWDKENGNSVFSDGEAAYQNTKESLRIFRYKWIGLFQKNMKNPEKRIHPTQKPVDLYKWILRNYAKPGQSIFDSHCGSGSIRIACHDMNFNFEGCEIDKDYYERQEKRYKLHMQQSELFGKNEIQDLVFKD